MPEEKKEVPEITNKKSEETPKDTVEEEARNTKNFEEEQIQVTFPHFRNNNYTINNIWSYRYNYFIRTGIYWTIRLRNHWRNYWLSNRHNYINSIIMG
jgi:hypothetical protein